MSRRVPPWVKNGAVLVATLLAIAIADRMLDSRLRRRLWESDPVLHYRHRPGAISTWGSEYGNKPIRINRYGQHDDDFPETKPDGELRGLILGDSIVMGHGMTAAEAFANQLERLLAARASGFRSVQVINAGVQGYSTYQYAEVLKRSLRFAPDFVVVCFCMNDVTEPFIVDRARGGTGQDYHGVFQSSNPWVDVLVNRTGFGLLAMEIRARFLKRQIHDRYQIYNVRRMAERSRTDSVFVAAWKSALSDLDGIYDTCRRSNVPVILMVSPHTFQLNDPSLQEPQRILKEHAAANGIPFVDMTEVVENAVRAGVPVSALFLDEDHYTVQGHALVAETLLRMLDERGIARAS